MSDTNTLVPVMARMPKRTREKLAERAASEGRSLSQMLTRIAEQALHTPETAKPKAP